MTETRQNYPTYHAQVTPDKVAVINATTGDQMTYKQLDDRSNQIVHLLRAHGIERGDVISVFADNKIDIFSFGMGRLPLRLLYHHDQQILDCRRGRLHR